MGLYRISLLAQVCAGSHCESITANPEYKWRVIFLNTNPSIVPFAPVTAAPLLCHGGKCYPFFVEPCLLWPRLRLHLAVDVCEDQSTGVHTLHTGFSWEWGEKTVQLVKALMCTSVKIWVHTCVCMHTDIWNTPIAHPSSQISLKRWVFRMKCFPWIHSVQDSS